MHTQPSGRARGLVFDLSLRLLPWFVEGSGDTVQMCSLSVFAICWCDKYQNSMCWLIYNTAAYETVCN